MSSDKSKDVLQSTLATVFSAIGAVTAAVAVGKFLHQQLHPAKKKISAKIEDKLNANVERLKRAKVIAILRLKNYEKAMERVQELVDMGYGALEVTTDSVGYYDGLLKEVVSMVGDRCLVGVGTITTLKQLEIAHEGGAAFALSPVNPKHDGFEVNGFTHECHSRGIVAMPAAYTPQEVYECYVAGAKTVKLFPAQKWTPKQLKSLKGVGDFKDVNICPSGGIDHNNAAEWLAAGATAVGMGSCLAGRDIKIADSSSEAFKFAVDLWETKERPAAQQLAQELGLSE